jgi:transcriptional regulator with XRE-family HTH domain
MLERQIGANIARLRESKGWSRPDLAKRVKPATSPQQIERLEKGQRQLTIKWIEKLAAALSVEPYQLIMPQAGPLNGVFRLSEPVARRVAHTFAMIALGDEPEEHLVTDLVEVLQEFAATFAAHPATRSDAELVSPVAGLLERRFSR